jgi:hypothetical protein
MRRNTRALLVLAVLCLVGLGACGDDPDATSGTEPGPTSVAPGAPTTSFDERTAPAEVVSPRADLVGERPTAPIAVAIDPADDRLVRVRFWNGVTACYGARAVATETPTSVTVAVFTGTIPEAVGKLCIEMAVLQELTVPLTAPLASRSLHGSDP